MRRRFADARSREKDDGCSCSVPDQSERLLFTALCFRYGLAPFRRPRELVPIAGTPGRDVSVCDEALAVAETFAERSARSAAQERGTSSGGARHHGRDEEGSQARPEAVLVDADLVAVVHGRGVALPRADVQLRALQLGSWGGVSFPDGGSSGFSMKSFGSSPLPSPLRTSCGPPRHATPLAARPLLVPPYPAGARLLVSTPAPNCA